MVNLKTILAVLLVTLSLSFISAEDTNVTLNVEDSPPYIIQDIDDIFLIVNEDAVNYLDLDDYFGEDNGDELNITYSSIENVTITIDSEHRVSFYPDTGYLGTQNLRFTVADAAGQAVGNYFQLTVGQDTMPPKWYNPQKTRSLVYQNSVLNFTTLWTDNVRLGSYIFSINQGDGWVNSSRIVFTGTQNTSNTKTQISASPLSTVYWRFYAEDFYGNKNATEIQTFTVREYEEGDGGTIEVEYDGDGENAGGGAGTLENPIVDAILQNQEATDFKVDVNNLKVSLRQGDTTTKVITITNTGTQGLEFKAAIAGLTRFATVGSGTFYLAPQESKKLVLDFRVSTSTIPDQYFGTLKIQAKDKSEEVPIVLEVRAFESEIELTVVVPEKSKNIRAAETAMASIKLSSIRDMTEMPITIYYAVMDFSGNVINTSTKEVQLFASLEETLDLFIPRDTPDGEYLFYVRATGKGVVDIGSDTLFIGARFKIMKFLGNFLYLIIFLILIAILIILYLNHQRTQAKQQALELYVMLNELRDLVKEGKTTEAVEIYKRIKITYGQHISKNFQKDKELLKLELDKFSKLLKENPIKTSSPAKTQPAASAKSPAPIKPETTKTEPKPVTPAAKPTTVQQPKVATPAAKPVTNQAEVVEELREDDDSPEDEKEDLKEVPKNAPMAIKMASKLINLKDKIIKPKEEQKPIQEKTSSDKKPKEEQAKPTTKTVTALTAKPTQAKPKPTVQSKPATTPTKPKEENPNEK